MKLTGYDGFDWEPLGFLAGLPDGWIPYPAVEPVILERAGTFATFGPSQISELTIPVNFVTTPEAFTVYASIEAAWLDFFKRLNPYDTRPRQLRGERNDGTPIAVDAVMRVIPMSDDRAQNERFVDFVAVEPFASLAPSTASGTF